MTQSPLHHARWRKSSHSGQTGECVEVADLTDVVAVRDTKDRQGPMLTFDRGPFAAFVERAKTGWHDL